MEGEFCDSKPSADSAAQKSELDKRSEIQTLACVNVKKKRAADEKWLAESRMNMEGVNNIKRTILGIEAAKFFASSSANGAAIASSA